MIRYLVIFIFIAFALTKSYGQKLPLTTEQQIENLAELLEDDIEDDQFLQQLQLFLEHPLNLNVATADDLRPLRVLTDLQIANLLQYRKLFGNLLDIYELQAVPTWNVEMIRRLLPFITIAEKIAAKEELRNRMKSGDHSFLIRHRSTLEKQKGYDKTLSTHYLGSKDNLLLRYKYVYKNLLQYGLTADKDAGEQFFKGAQSKGFDFYSVHFFARQLGAVKALALGDFSVNMGQGLIQWGSLAFKKSADAIAVKRQAPTLLPYSSAGEYNYNRGAGITVQRGKIEATAFASHARLNANKTIDEEGEEVFSGFLTSGFHRTPSEIADRYSIWQTAFGGTISYQTAVAKLGFNTVHYRFSTPLQKRAEPYNLFAANGKSWSNYSVDYGLTYKNIHFFGEAALDKRGGKAFMGGAMIAVDPKADLSFVYRNIGADYAALYGNAFTENVYPANEKGFYAGITIRPEPRLRLDAYADFYSFPFIKFRTDAPGRGQDHLIQLTYKPSRQVELYSRFRSENKGSNDAGDSVLHFLVQKTRQNWRTNLVYQITPLFTFKARTDLVWYNRKESDAEEGFLIYVEGAYRFNRDFSANLRLQHFETDGFNSRLYAYESDVLYGYSIPPFFDKGFRYYTNLNYDLSKKLSVWLRWAQTLYKSKEAIGSGLDEIKGNKRSEVKVQVRYIL